MGKKVEYKTSPFFWTRFCNKSFGYVGFEFDHSEVVYKGDVDAGKFMAVYCNQNECFGASGAGMGANMILFN